MSLEAGGRAGTKEKEENEDEKIPYMCESIGHRPLRGRCLKGDRPTDGRAKLGIESRARD